MYFRKMHQAAAGRRPSSNRKWYSTFGTHTDVRTFQRSLQHANFGGAVLGCIEAKFCKKICVWKLSPRSTQCTPLHSALCRSRRELSNAYRKCMKVCSFRNLQDWHAFQLAVVHITRASVRIHRLHHHDVYTFSFSYGFFRCASALSRKTKGVCLAVGESLYFRSVAFITSRQPAYLASTSYLETKRTTELFIL